MSGPQYGFGQVPIDLSPNMIGSITWGANGVEGSTFTAINLNGSALDKWTMTVSSTGPTSIAYTYQGIAYSHTIAASATAAGVVANIEALTGTIPLLQFADLAVTGSTTFTATAKALGVTFTMTAVSNLAVSHTTTGSVGSDIPQGVAVLGLTTGSGPGSQGVPSISTVDNLVAQVLTLTPSYAASSFYEILVTLRAYQNGNDLPIACGKVAASTNTATDCTAIAAAINAAMPTYTVIADGSSGTTVVCTAEVKGLAFDITVTVSGGNATCSTTYTTGAPGDATTDLNAGWAGIVPHSGRIVQNSSYNPVWQAGTVGPVAGACACHITVLDTNAESPSARSSVWVLTGGSYVGQFVFTAGQYAAPLSLRAAAVVATDTNDGVKLSINPGTY